MTENDWKWFCEEWGGIKEKGLSVIVDFSNNAGNDLVGSCKEILLSEEPCGPRDEENNEIESQRPVVRTFPEVIQNVNCFELFCFCYHAMANFELFRESNFDYLEVYVRKSYHHPFVTGKLFLQVICYFANVIYEGYIFS